ncbi:MAG TPA: DUF1223 domain-containing protein [Myxococcaceae bacterium]
MLVSAIALAGEVGMPSHASKTPVVVELFTSEGCSSCPSADSLLRDLEATQPVPGVEVIPLGLHVTYWDGLGWPDAYGNPAFADRQAGYAEAIGGGTYTPEMVVDGAVGFPGGRDRTVAALKEAASAPKAPVSVKVLKVLKDAVEVEVSLSEGARPDGAALVVALTQSGLSSDVKRGENAGRVLQHAAVVRTLKVLSAAPRATVRLPYQAAWDQKSMSVVAFTQGRSHRHVLGAARVPVVPAS